MEIQLNKEIISNYKSPSQIARILTEEWVNQNIFCPNCGHHTINKYENNRPVADFQCLNCLEDFELKSKKNSLSTKIVDGAYASMINSLESNKIPNFFLLTYDHLKFEVNSFLIIPKHFFTPKIIEKRKPLSENAKRAGWVGCNILLNEIPNEGKIFFIQDKQIYPKNKILHDWQKTLFLRNVNTSHKGWLLDIIKCIEKINENIFSLKDIYAFENDLKKLYPSNENIKPKIRQQLQVLRNQGYLTFLGRGNYKVNLKSESSL